MIRDVFEILGEILVIVALLVATLLCLILIFYGFMQIVMLLTGGL